MFGSPAGWQAEKEMKDRQRCQSEAEARLSVGSAIAVPAITISLKKSSLSGAWSHRRESPEQTMLQTEPAAAMLAPMMEGFE